jgi:periplasmic protein TonB
VIRSSLGPAFLTSIAVHLGALMVISIAWSWLRVFSPPAHLNETELMMVVPVPQPVAPTEPEDIAVPPPATEEEVTTIPPSPPPPDEPMTPPTADPITPPKIVEKTAPTRVEPRPKTRPAPKPARVKKPPPDRTHEPVPEPRDVPTRGDRGDSKPGPHLPWPNETVDTAAGNVLGPSSAPKAEEHPPAPVEGGEAGAGNLFDKGDVGVIPGAGIGGGSGARGSGGLGLGNEGKGARLGGVRPGPGGDGAGEGVGSTSPPTGGYQVKPRYPDSARRRGIEGTVVVMAYVTEQGRVEKVQVEQSAGHTDLDQAAVEAVGRWRFEPARRGRQPVAMWVSIPVKFVLNR